MKLTAYLQLMRFHRPIGILLLLWPTLWALWLASNGHPSPKIVIIFVLGVVVMRAAGCVINDLADRKLDGFVERTQSRPLVTGQVSVREAQWLFVSLIAIAFILVLQTNLKTILYSFVALGVASLYPFTKRFTQLPQFVLGAAFAWAIPMAYTAQNQPLTIETWLLYLATLLWTVVFDTQYAMADRPEDLKIGIKSTAILFGRYDRLIIGLLQLTTLVLLALVGVYYLTLALAAALFFYQQWLIRNRIPDQCFKAFLNNHWVGASVFLGLTL